LRIVVRAADAREARDAQAVLASAGIQAAALAGAYRPAPDGEDIAIFTGEGAATLARSAALAETPPIARLAAVRYTSPPALNTVDPAPYSGAITLDAPPKLLRAQVDAWTRVAIAEEERARRAATAAAVGVTAPPPAEPGKLKALYIGAPSSMFLALERVLAERGGLVAAAFTSYAGFDHLHDEPFDAVVLNGAQDSNTAISLCAALRRNATLYHLPTLMLTKPGDAATAAAAIDRGASAICAETMPCAASLGWLFEAVRRERRRRTAEHDMRTLRDVMGEARTGLWQRASFDAHLARLAADHHASGRPMSMVVLRVTPAIGAREPSEAVWRKGFTEIASLAARLMRDADCGVTMGADLIALALPASNLRSAKRTAERIASVAECTAFASGEGDAGPLVFEQSTVELQPGESGAGMLARALRAIEVESIPA
jgi:two-component system cell cycle response regulator PopA